MLFTKEKENQDQQLAKWQTLKKKILSLGYISVNIFIYLFLWFMSYLSNRTSSFVHCLRKSLKCLLFFVKPLREILL